MRDLQGAISENAAIRQELRRIEEKAEDAKAEAVRGYNYVRKNKKYLWFTVKDSDSQFHRCITFRHVTTIHSERRWFTVPRITLRGRKTGKPETYSPPRRANVTYDITYKQVKINPAEI